MGLVAQTRKRPCRGSRSLLACRGQIRKHLPTRAGKGPAPARRQIVKRGEFLEGSIRRVNLKFRGPRLCHLRVCSLLLRGGPLLSVGACGRSGGTHLSWVAGFASVVTRGEIWMDRRGSAWACVLAGPRCLNFRHKIMLPAGKQWVLISLQSW